MDLFDRLSILAWMLLGAALAVLIWHETPPEGVEPAALGWALAKLIFAPCGV